MPEATERIHLSVKTVIGDPDPLLASIMLLPLVCDWGVPRECIWNLTGEKCEKPLARLYVLNEPLLGFGGGDAGYKTVGACKEHHKQIAGPDGAEPPDA